MSDQSERLHLEGLDEATERERWEEHHAPPEAAALTEQEQQAVLDAIWSLTSTSETGYPQTKWGIDFKVIESILAARLADSRPAVTEGAIEAATGVLTQKVVDYFGIADAAICRMLARAALSAALPHMGDGKADADLRDRIERLAEESADYCCKSEWDQRQYDSVIRDIRGLLLSPTGDDTP